jgi:hypothetical protein
MVGEEDGTVHLSETVLFLGTSAIYLFDVCRPQFVPTGERRVLAHQLILRRPDRSEDDSRHYLSHRLQCGHGPIFPAAAACERYALCVWLSNLGLGCSRRGAATRYQ